MAWVTSLELHGPRSYAAPTWSLLTVAWEDGALPLRSRTDPFDMEDLRAGQTRRATAGSRGLD